VESKCILFVIERSEVCPKLVRGEATRVSSKDVWSKWLDKYCESILNNFLIEPMYFYRSIRQ
jgi:hypothetical protein